jgi:antitoxin PrlF
MNALSKISSKAQTVIPKVVREKLRLKPGDLLRYRLEKDRIVIEKASSEAEDDPFAVFVEWGGASDEEAYKTL